MVLIFYRLRHKLGYAGFPHIRRERSTVGFLKSYRNDSDSLFFSQLQGKRGEKGQRGDRGEQGEKGESVSRF